MSELSFESWLLEQDGPFVQVFINNIDDDPSTVYEIKCDDVIIFFENGWLFWFPEKYVNTDVMIVLPPPREPDDE